MRTGRPASVLSWLGDSKLSARRARCDLAMIVLMVLTILDRYTFNTLHEWIGLALAGLFVRHMALNARWIRALPSGRWDSAKAGKLAVSLLLLAAFAAAVATGALMSQTVFLPFYPDDWYVPLDWHIWHIASALWCLILSGVHLGMHWEMFGERLRRWCASALGVSFSPGAWRALALLLAACGAYGFFSREMVWYLTMQMTHLVYEETDTFFAMARDYTCLAALAAWSAFYARKGFGLAARAGRKAAGSARAAAAARERKRAPGRGASLQGASEQGAGT